MTGPLAYPLVRILWRDSRRPHEGWVRIADIDDLSDCECVSVGYLIGELKTCKLLAPNLGDIGDDPQACGIIAIPNAAITTMEVLEGRSDEA